MLYGFDGSDTRRRIEVMKNMQVEKFSLKKVRLHSIFRFTDLDWITYGLG